jgi:hypothetical protein
MLRNTRIRTVLRASVLILIAALCVGATVRVWVQRSETYIDFAPDADPHASQMSTYGQFAFMKRFQTFYRATGPSHVESHTTFSSVGIIASALSTIVVLGLTLTLVAPSSLRRAKNVFLRAFGRSESGILDSGATRAAQADWRRLTIIAFVATIAGAATCIVCAFFYPGMLLTPAYLVGVAVRLFFMDFVPTLVILVALHCLIRKIRAPRLVLLVIFVAVALLVCELTNKQWWAIAIAVTISLAASLLYVVGPLRIWRSRVQQRSATAPFYRP